MKLINQSFEIINQTDFSLKGILKHIERCARVSYKSEDKITEDSYKKFVDMLVSRHHDRPLEFGTVYLNFDENKAYKVEKYKNNPWSKVKTIVDQDDDTPNIYATVKHYVTTNYRVIKENNLEDDLKYICSPTEYHYKRYTVHMILDRGVMDEFRTHVGLSHLAESTRYCNYSKDKFNNEVTFIKPNWYKGHTDPYYNVYEPGYETSELFIQACEDAESWYFTLLKEGLTPQQARSVLPLGIKSELISCGFADAWDNFFYRRDASDAHPMAQEITKPLHEEFIRLRYV